MKKVLFALIAVVLLLAAAILIVPSFIDWNRYKSEISANAASLTGRSLQIDGDVSLVLLPAPTLKAERVRLANLPGGSEPQMATLKSLEVRVASLPLLRGEIQVESIALVEPVILLEVLADGRRNWEFSKEPGDAAPAQPEAPGEPDGGTVVRLDRLAIEGGTLLYRDHRSGQAESVERIDARLKAGSLAGPFEGQGNLVARGIPIGFSVSSGAVEARRPVPVSASFDLKSSKAKLQFQGQLADLETAPRISGRLRSEGENMAALLQSVRLPDVPPGLAKGFALDVQIAASAAEATLKDLVLKLGEASANGAASAAFGERLVLDATLNVSHLDLDGLAGGKAPPAATETAPASPVDPPARPSNGNDAGFELPARMAGTVNLSIAALTWRSNVVRQVQLAAKLQDGAVMLSRGGALLPGGSDVTVSGKLTTPEKAPRFDGRLEASSDNLRALLEWLQLDISKVPQERLRKLQYASGVTATPELLQLADLDLRLDGSRLTGAAAAAMKTRPSFSADLVLDRINLDAYMPGPVTAPAAAAAPVPAAPQPAPPPIARRPALAALNDFDGQIGIRIGQLTLKQVPIENLALEARLIGGKLDLKQLSVQKAAGASMALSGVASEFGGSPSYELKGRLEAQDLVDLARVAGVALPPQVAQLKGIDLQTAAKGGMTAVELTEVKAKAGSLELAGQVGASWAGPRPKVTAKLAATDVLLDSFLPPAGAAAQAGGPGRPAAAGGQAAPRAPGGERWSREPLDLAVLSSFDADLDLAARRLDVRGYDIGEPKLVLKLENGVVEANQVGGRLWGGTVKLKGRAANKPKPGIELNLTIDNADLKQALVQTAGMDTVSGRFGMQGEFRSAGQSQFELIQNLAGSAVLNARDGAIQKIDMKGLSDRLKRLSELPDYLDLLNRSFSGGQTRLQSANGTWTIERGIARSNDTQAQLEASAVMLAGSIDLPAFAMDLTGRLTLTEHPEAPTVGITLRGPIDNPERDFRTRELEQWLLQRIGSSLVRKGIGGDALKGILGGDKAPETPPAPGGAPEPEQPAKPADVLRGILRGLPTR